MNGWLELFAPLAALDAPARACLAALPILNFAKGKVLFAPGAACQGFVLLLEGRIRVGLTAENGRRLMLYRVTAGETCMQTTLCLLGDENYSAEGVAESELRLVIVPPALFQRLLRESSAFAHFVFGRFGARLGEMTRLVETIAFLRVDARLAAALLARAGSEAPWPPPIRIWPRISARRGKWSAASSPCSSAPAICGWDGAASSLQTATPWPIWLA